MDIFQEKGLMINNFFSYPSTSRKLTDFIDTKFLSISILIQPIYVYDDEDDDPLIETK